jgi:hypothetical protein
MSATLIDSEMSMEVDKETKFIGKLRWFTIGLVFVGAWLFISGALLTHAGSVDNNSADLWFGVATMLFGLAGTALTIYLAYDTSRFYRYAQKMLHWVASKSTTIAPHPATLKTPPATTQPPRVQPTVIQPSTRNPSVPAPARPPTQTAGNPFDNILL